MSGVWGNNIKISIFGESHGTAIGVVIDGLPSGISLDMDEIRNEMARRAPGSSDLTTPRKEADSIEILSGYFNNFTTGTPLCGVIRNTNTKSKDYSELKYTARPGHADYTGYVKYKGFNDYRGGGHFSGRITAPIVFAGAIAKQILKSKDIVVGSHIYSIQDIIDTPFDLCGVDETILHNISLNEIPVIHKDIITPVRELVQETKKAGDSVGGIIEAVILNIPAGLGAPYFDSIESSLSHILFSIPAVKGIEFGAGFNISRMKGSQANDPFYTEGGKVKTLTNNNGGILGGITSGMPLIFRCAIKPTPSISIQQKSINMHTIENADLSVHGRHDPCIVFRAVPVIESAAALCILDFLVNDL